MTAMKCIANISSQVNSLQYGGRKILEIPTAIQIHCTSFKNARNAMYVLFTTNKVICHHSLAWRLVSVHFVI